jgi:HSP20 family protein
MMRMIAPRFDIALRPSRSLFDTWFNPYRSFMECEDWSPASDIAETEKLYVVTMELPGIDMKKTDISYNDGMLTVKGEKGKESMEGECCHCVERYSGSFERSFRIPGKIDSDKIDATYKDGVLKLTLPKAKESMPKKIVVH